MYVERVLEDVRCVSAHREPSAGCQVATVAAHGLHHEDTPLSAAGRLFDGITALERKPPSSTI